MRCASSATLTAMLVVGCGARPSRATVAKEPVLGVVPEPPTRSGKPWRSAEQILWGVQASYSAAASLEADFTISDEFGDKKVGHVIFVRPDHVYWYFGVRDLVLCDGKKVRTYHPHVVDEREDPVQHSVWLDVFLFARTKNLLAELNDVVVVDATSADSRGDAGSPRSYGVSGRVGGSTRHMAFRVRSDFTLVAIEWLGITYELSDLSSRDEAGPWTDDQPVFKPVQ